MAVPVGHGCSRSDQPQWNYKDLKNCHNVWPPFQPSNLPTFQPSNPSNPSGEILSKVKSKLWFQLSERAPPRTYKRWSRRFILFSIQVSLKENYEAAYIHQTNLNSESFLFYCFFRNSPAPASAENLHPSKLLPVVDRDPEDSHKSEQIFSPACQKVPNIRKVPQKMYKNSKRHLGTIIDHVLKELEK